LKGLHIVVTGASSGIGAALVQAFSTAGAAVTLIARRLEAMRALAGELGSPTHVARCDLSVPETCAAWIPEAIAALGPIDVLINNAGVQVIDPTHLVDVEAGERSLALNLVAPLRLTRAVLPSMLERGRGTIVNITSMAALAPTPGMTYYNASKAGLAAASEALRGELLRTPVNVVTVYPGIIQTDMATPGLARYGTSRALAAQPRGDALVLAQLVVGAVHRGRARVIYPRFNALARSFPGITRWVMDHFSPPLV
jgi:short-subunit dehydrogenase